MFFLFDRSASENPAGNDPECDAKSLQHECRKSLHESVRKEPGRPATVACCKRTFRRCNVERLPGTTRKTTRLMHIRLVFATAARPRYDAAMAESAPTSQPASPGRKLTVPRFSAAKRRGEKLAMLTAYDFPTARRLDRAGIDAILVGDTLGMVIQGRNTTLPVTLDQMIYHGEMVARAADRALVVVDLPFGSYHESPQQAVAAGIRVVKETGCDAIKLEGGRTQQEAIRQLVDAGIPVMGHVGLRPQAVNVVGGYKIQRGRDALLDDARAVEEAGAFSVVLELVAAADAAAVTEALAIPTIGIGSGVQCDGQVLVTPDMLGCTDGFKPTFLKEYAAIGEAMTNGFSAYVQDVKAGTYPDDDHTHQ